MSLLFIALIIIVVWLTPWVFRYLILVPTLGTCLGGFLWGLVGLLSGGALFTPQAFAGFVILGCVIVTMAVKKSL